MLTRPGIVFPAAMSRPPGAGSRSAARVTTAAALAVLCLLVGACGSSGGQAIDGAAVEDAGPRLAAPVEYTEGGFRYRIEFEAFDRIASPRGKQIARPGSSYVALSFKVTNLQNDRPAPGPTTIRYLATAPDNAEIVQTRGFLGSSQRCKVGGSTNTSRVGDQTPDDGLPPAFRGIPEGWCMVPVERSETTPRQQIRAGGENWVMVHTESALLDEFPTSALTPFAQREDRQASFGLGYVEVPTQ